MEQQPGPVNWAPYNPIPAPGHGEAVDDRSARARRRSRQLLPLATGAVRAGADACGAQPAGPARTSPGGREAGEAARDLARLGDLPPGGRAPVALVFDYEAAWVLRNPAAGRLVPLSRTGLPLVRGGAPARARRRSSLRPGDRLEGYPLVARAEPADRLRSGASGLRGGRRRRCLRAAVRLEDPPVSHPRRPAAGAAARAHSDAGDRSRLDASGRRDTGVAARSPERRNGGANISRRTRASWRASPDGWPALVRRRPAPLPWLLAERGGALFADGASRGQSRACRRIALPEGVGFAGAAISSLHSTTDSKPWPAPFPGDADPRQIARGRAAQLLGMAPGILDVNDTGQRPLFCRVLGRHRSSGTRCVPRKAESKSLDASRRRGSGRTAKLSFPLLPLVHVVRKRTGQLRRERLRVAIAPAAVGFRPAPP